MVASKPKSAKRRKPSSQGFQSLFQARDNEGSDVVMDYNKINFYPENVEMKKKMSILNEFFIGK